MHLIDVLTISSLFIIIFVSVVNIGFISNKLIFKKENYLEINLIYGMLILSFLIGTILSLKIFDINIVLGILFLSYFKFFFYKEQILINLLNLKKILIYFFLILIFFASLKNNFYTLDDLNGYFYVINNFVNKINLYNPDLQHRIYFSYPFYLALNSLFISLSDFYSAWFFDIFFGASIILFTAKRNIKEKNIYFYFITLITILLTTVTIQETNTPKLIVVGLLIFILFEIEKFYKNNDYLFSVLALSSLLIIFKFTNIASFTNCMLAIMLINKFLTKNIYLKEITKPLLFSFLIFLPWFIYNYQVFQTPLGLLIDSPYHYFKNSFFLELDFKYIHQQKLVEYLYSRQLLLCLILSSIYFIFIKDAKFFKIILISSFFISMIIFMKTLFPDKSNFLRYMQPFFSSYAVFLFIKIYNQLAINKKKFKNFILIFLICLFAIRVNLNVTIFMNNSINNISYLIFKNYSKFYKSANKHFDIEELYPKNYKSKINEIALLTDFKKTLLLISRPYLFDFNKYNNFDYIEWQYGFSITKQTYPLLQNNDAKIQFFKKKKIKYFLIEKRYLNHNNGLFFSNLNQNQNTIEDNVGRVINSHLDTLLYDDLMDFIIKYPQKKLIAENTLFNLYEFKY
jgi:hypothetical protein